MFLVVLQLELVNVVVLPYWETVARTADAVAVAIFQTQHWIVDVAAAWWVKIFAVVAWQYSVVAAIAASVNGEYPQYVAAPKIVAVLLVFV